MRGTFQPFLLFVVAQYAFATSSSTTLSAPPSPIAFGSPITLRADVSATTAAGNVTFYDGVSVVGIARLNAGTATLTTRVLGPGSHDLRARYNGDAVLEPSTSPVVSITVQSAVSQGFLRSTIPLNLDFQFGGFLAADFNGDGRADLAINNYPDGALQILLASDGGSFTLNPPVNIGTQPVISMTAADFNGDGATDLAILDISPSIRIFLGDGTGLFQSAGSAAIQASTIVSGDMNSDGIIDIIATSGYANSFVSVLLGKGDGSFASPHTSALQAGVQIAVADFDGDGRADVARDTTSPNSMAFGLEVLKGDGQGNLTSVFEWKAPGQISGVAAADFNSDGAPDLLAGSGMYLYIFSGKTDGTFTDPSKLELPANSRAIYVSDFNGDGELDALVTLADSTESGFVVAKGDGAGGFTLDPYRNGLGFHPDPLVIGEFNGDARTDILGLGSSLWLYAGAAPSDLTITMSHSGSFSQGQTSADYTITVQNIGPSSTMSPASVTINLPSISVNPPPTSTPISMSGSGWTCPQTFPPGYSPQCNRSDALAAGASYPPIRLSVRVSTTAPPLVTPKATIATQNFTDSNPVNDISKDPTKIRQNQSISFSGPADRLVGSAAFALSATASSGLPVSFSASGACTITGAVVTLGPAGMCTVVASQSGNDAFFPATDVTRTFQVGATLSSVELTAPATATIGAATSLVAYIQPADATGRVAFYDGYTVLGSAPVSGGTASLSVRMRATGTRQLRARFLATGTSMGATSPVVNQTVTSQPSVRFTSTVVSSFQFTLGMDVGDFNNDGNPDLVAGNNTQLFVGLGDGHGGFGTPIRSTPSPAFTTIRQVMVADFNGDGLLDVLSTHQSTDGQQQGLRIWLGKGDGTFSAGAPVSMETSSMLTTDFNRDGRMDLVMYQPARQSVGIFYGKPDGSLEPGIFYPLITAGGAVQLAAGDLNNDGSLDVVATTRTTSGLASELLIQVVAGNGSGGFQSASLFHKEPAPSSLSADQISLGDLNADGILDLVVAQDPCSVLTLLGSGTGTFQTAKRVPCSAVDTLGYAGGIAIVDFDGDGKQDVGGMFAANNGSFQLFRGNGDGTLQFATVAQVPSVRPPMQFAVADLDADGRMDFIAASSAGVNVVRGGGGPLLQLSMTTSPQIIQAPNSSVSVALIVSNAGNEPTTGQVAMGGVAGLAYAQILDLDGAGWSCSVGQCTRSDVLAPGASYPPITFRLSFSIATTATLNASVSGGNSQPTASQATVRAVSSASGSNGVITSVSTAASFPADRIAPNGWVEIKGLSLVPADTPAAGVIWSNAPEFASGQMPTNLGGVHVTVNGVLTYVYFYCSAITSPICLEDQINVLLPPSWPAGQATITVENANASRNYPIATLPSVPSFLKFGDGAFATATHADFSLLGPTYLYPGYSTPARPGESIVLWAVGLGLPVDPITPGSATQRSALPLPITCKVGGLPAPAVVNLVSPGLYQVNLTISPDLSFDPTIPQASVACNYGDMLFGATVTISPN